MFGGGERDGQVIRREYLDIWKGGGEVWELRGLAHIDCTVLPSSEVQKTYQFKELLNNHCAGMEKGKVWRRKGRVVKEMS